MPLQDRYPAIADKIERVRQAMYAADPDGFNEEQFEQEFEAQLPSFMAAAKNILIKERGMTPEAANLEVGKRFGTIEPPQGTLSKLFTGGVDSFVQRTQQANAINQNAIGQFIQDPSLKTGFNVAVGAPLAAASVHSEPYRPLGTPVSQAVGKGFEHLAEQTRQDKWVKYTGAAESAWPESSRQAWIVKRPDLGPEWTTAQGKFGSEVGGQVLPLPLEWGSPAQKQAQVGLYGERGAMINDLLAGAAGSLLGPDLTDLIPPGVNKLGKLIPPANRAAPAPTVLDQFIPPPARPAEPGVFASDAVNAVPGENYFRHLEDEELFRGLSESQAIDRRMLELPGISPVPGAGQLPRARVGGPDPSALMAQMRQESAQVRGLDAPTAPANAKAAEMLAKKALSVKGPGGKIVRRKQGNQPKSVGSAAAQDLDRTYAKAGKDLALDPRAVETGVTDEQGYFPEFEPRDRIPESPLEGGLGHGIPPKELDATSQVWREKQRQLPFPESAAQSGPAQTPTLLDSILDILDEFRSGMDVGGGSGARFGMRRLPRRDMGAVNIPGKDIPENQSLAKTSRPGFFDYKGAEGMRNQLTYQPQKRNVWPLRDPILGEVIESARPDSRLNEPQPRADQVHYRVGENQARRRLAQYPNELQPLGPGYHEAAQQYNPEMAAKIQQDPFKQSFKSDSYDQTPRERELSGGKSIERNIANQELQERPVPARKEIVESKRLGLTQQQIDRASRLTGDAREAAIDSALAHREQQDAGIGDTWKRRKVDLPATSDKIIAQGVGENIPRNRFGEDLDPRLMEQRLQQELAEREIDTFGRGGRSWEAADNRLVDRGAPEDLANRAAAERLSPQDVVKKKSDSGPGTLYANPIEPFIKIGEKMGAPGQIKPDQLARLKLEGGRALADIDALQAMRAMEHLPANERLALGDKILAAKRGKAIEQFKQDFKQAVPGAQAEDIAEAAREFDSISPSWAEITRQFKLGGINRGNAVIKALGRAGVRALRTLGDLTVLYNPGIHLPNVIGDTMFGTAAGANWIWITKNTDKILDVVFGKNQQIAKELIGRSALGSEMFDEAVQLERRALEQSVRQTLRKQSGKLNSYKLFQVLYGADEARRAVRSTAGMALNLPDQFMKVALAMQSTELGIRNGFTFKREVFKTADGLPDWDRAAQHVQDYMPNYRTMLPQLRKITGESSFRLLANMYARFPAESARIYKNILTKRPVYAGGAAAMSGGLLSALWLGANSQFDGPKWSEIKSERQKLPPYQRNKLLIPKPWKSRKGRVQWWDMSYIVPLGDMVVEWRNAMNDPTLNGREKLAAFVKNTGKKYASGGALTRESYESPDQRAKSGLDRVATQVSPAYRKISEFGNERRFQEDNDPVRGIMDILSFRTVEGGLPATMRTKSFYKGQEAELNRLINETKDPSKTPNMQVSERVERVKKLNAKLIALKKAEAANY